MRVPRRRWELSTLGNDEFLELVGGNASGTLANTGLRIPTLPTDQITGGQFKRYLFQLATHFVGIHEIVRIRGLRQLLTIGTDAAGAGPPATDYIIEQPVVSPTWRFQDGNVSWHLMIIKPRQPQRGRPSDGDGFVFEFTPAADALLYEAVTLAAGDVNAYGKPDFYQTALLNYTPPNGGVPYGSPADAQLGFFTDMRFPWNDNNAWRSLDIPVAGPCYIAFFASVRQTNPTGRTQPVFPVNPPVGLPPEELFLRSFPTTSIYWRIAGALILEEEVSYADDGNVGAT